MAEKKKKATPAEEVADTAAENTAAVDESAELKRELDEAKDMLMRTAAEFDNYKKRTEKERLQLAEHVRASTARPLLAVLDNIERATGADEQPGEYTKGLELIIKQVSAAAEQMGLKAIEAEGKPFDPNMHDAVMHIDDENYGENVVVQVLQTGYVLGDTVVRPAMVKVAN